MLKTSFSISTLSHIVLHGGHHHSSPSPPSFTGWPSPCSTHLMWKAREQAGASQRTISFASVVTSPEWQSEQMISSASIPSSDTPPTSGGALMLTKVSSSLCRAAAVAAEAAAPSPAGARRWQPAGQPVVGLHAVRGASARRGFALVGRQSTRGVALAVGVVEALRGVAAAVAPVAKLVGAAIGVLSTGGRAAGVVDANLARVTASAVAAALFAGVSILARRAFLCQP